MEYKRKLVVATLLFAMLLARCGVIIEQSVLEANAGQLAVEDVQEYRDLPSYSDPRAFISWIPGKPDLLAQTWNETIWRYDLRTGVIEKTLPFEQYIDEESGFTRYGPVTFWTHEGNRVVGEAFHMHWEGRSPITDSIPFIIDLEEGESRLYPTPNGGFARVLAISPDGEQAVVEELASFPLGISQYLLDLQTGEWTRLSLSEEGDLFSVAAWTPNRDFLVVNEVRRAITDDPFSTPFSSIYIVRLDGTGKRYIVKDRIDIEGIALSPDGNKIAWTERIDEELADRRFVIASIDGSEEKELLVSSEHELNFFLKSNLAWSEDGTKIAFTARSSGDVHIWVITLRVVEG